MDEILQKTKKGGYKYIKALPEDRRPSGKFAKMVMEVEFWQALGKACGWPEKATNPNHISDYYWKDYALRFHEINLTEGWDKAVKYLEEITK